jgi:hypothetical protein
VRPIKPGVRGRLGWAARTHRHAHPRSIAARMRLLWHDFVIHGLFEGSERCQDCGRDYVLWEAPNDLYREVHGSPHGLLCPDCFARQAREKGIVILFAATVFKRASAPTEERA